MQDYFKILKLAKFYYFGAFDSIEDFALRPIVENLHIISKENNLDLFTGVLRVPKKTPSPSDSKPNRISHSIPKFRSTIGLSGSDLVSPNHSLPQESLLPFFSPKHSLNSSPDGSSDFPIPTPGPPKTLTQDPSTPELPKEQYFPIIPKLKFSPRESYYMEQDSRVNDMTIEP